MNELIQILMRRDGLSQQEALGHIADAREAIIDAFEHGGDYEDVFNDWFGLELDYLLDVIGC